MRTHSDRRYARKSIPVYARDGDPFSQENQAPACRPTHVFLANYACLDFAPAATYHDLIPGVGRLEQAYPRGVGVWQAAEKGVAAALCRQATLGLLTLRRHGYC